MQALKLVVQAAQLSFRFFWVGTPASLTTKRCVSLPTAGSAEASLQAGEQTSHCVRHSFTQSFSGGAVFFIAALAVADGAAVDVASAAFGGGAL
jgi:hypothetical protein